MQIGDQCFPISTFAGIAGGMGVLVAFQVAYCYLAYRRRKNDEVWHVKPEELELSYPVEVIGQGAFGVVLAAEYRGTKVAIKRVIPPESGTGSKKLSSRQARTGSGMVGSGMISASASASVEASVENESDPEIGQGSSAATNSESKSRGTTSDSNLSAGLFGAFPMAHERTVLQRWFPRLFGSDLSRANLSLLETGSGATRTKSAFAKIFPSCDEVARRQEEFKNEMRLLSRLRHPCECCRILSLNFHPFRCPHQIPSLSFRYHNCDGCGYAGEGAHVNHGIHGQRLAL